MGRHARLVDRRRGRVPRILAAAIVILAFVAASLTIPYWQGRAEATGATPGYPTITGPASGASGNTSTPITIGNFTLGDAMTGGTACNLSSVRAVISTSLGTISASTPSGGTISGGGTATVTLTGSISAVEASLDAATLTSTTAGTATVTTTFRPNNSQTIGGVGYVFSVTTGHYYRREQFAADTWANNRTAASNLTFCGAGGYLATVTTSSENDDIQALSNLGTNTLTMGGIRSTNASDPIAGMCTGLTYAGGDNANCLWYWVPGDNAPAGEQNAQFNAYATPSVYFHSGDTCSTNPPWQTCEPNNSGPIMTNWYSNASGSFTFGWDDTGLGNTSWTLVEFGNNTSYTAASVTSTVTVSLPACNVTTNDYTGDGSNGVSGASYRVVTYASGSTASCGGTWTAPAAVSSVDVLVIGGGGGGGSSCVGGGGGAGGFVLTTGLAVTPGATTNISVGAAGPGGSGTGCAGNSGTSGGTSSFGATTASGGGGGGSYNGTGQAGVAGASGGGGSGSHSAATVGAGGAASPSGQGNAGASGGGGITGNPGGGGGGSGSAGSAPSSGHGGNGGSGTASAITGTSVTYAAGGGGATDSGTAGQGGSSCGGNSAVGTGTAATAATGYGCGGGGGNGSQAGSSGSSGVVIVRYRLWATCTPTTTNYTADGTNGVSGARYRVVTFASATAAGCTATWTAPAQISSVDLLVVGGGGGGGSDAGGGGGGGGVRERSSVTVTGGSDYTVQVGDGGAAARCPRNADYNTSDNCDPRTASAYDGAGASGGSSSFDSITSAGGGGGGSKWVDGYTNAPGDGVAGASGGGGGHPSSQPGGAGTYATDGDAETLGNAGGTSHSGNDYAGGGGGASAAGSSGSASGPGSGGAGQPSTITGASVVYGSGGAGGQHGAGAGASGGSGAGNGATQSRAATAGTNGRGGGGGGGGNVGANFGVGGSGGSGTVIIRYRIDMRVTTTDQNPATAAALDVAFGKVSSAFSQSVTITGGLGPTFTYSVASGSLPAGLSLDGATGRTVTISGTPTAGGISTFTLRATDADSGNIVMDQQVTIAITELTMPSLLLVDPRASSLTTAGPSNVVGGSNMALCFFASDGAGAQQGASTLRFDTSTLGSAQASTTVNSSTVTLTNDNAFGEFKAHGSTAANIQALVDGNTGLRVSRSNGLASTFTFAVKAIPYWTSVPSCTDTNDGTVTQVVSVRPLGIQRTVTEPLSVG